MRNWWKIARKSRIFSILISKAPEALITQNTVTLLKLIVKKRNNLNVGPCNHGIDLLQFSKIPTIHLEFKHGYQSWTEFSRTSLTEFSHQMCFGELLAYLSLNCHSSCIVSCYSIQIPPGNPISQKFNSCLRDGRTDGRKHPLRERI